MNLNQYLLKYGGKKGSRHSHGLTLIEMSVTIALMMSLASIVIYSSSGVGDWKLAREAALQLRSVYVAQKSYLADHPTKSISSVSASELVPYLPDGATAIPTLESLEGGTLTIQFTVMPPVALSGTTVYDPSSGPKDGLWDVGAR
ncbi:MAG: type II secretion system protein [Verrucomicrobiae bacterium]|nr:type II secretion system protein [Verrucomicrobiae bacterium]